MLTTWYRSVLFSNQHIWEAIDLLMLFVPSFHFNWYKVVQTKLSRLRAAVSKYRVPVSYMQGRYSTTSQAHPVAFAMLNETKGKSCRRPAKFRTCETFLALTRMQCQCTNTHKHLFYVEVLNILYVTLFRLV